MGRVPAPTASQRVLDRWTRRFRQLAALGQFHPTHKAFKDWYPCPVCSGDSRGFLSRLESSQSTLLTPLHYSGDKADRLMVFLWWYWTTMHIVLRDARKALALAGSRVRGHRARKRGTVRSLTVSTVVSGFFTGEIGNSDRFHAEVVPPDLVVKRRVMDVGPPPVKPRGRPAPSREPSGLVPLAAATLLHCWLPRRRSWDRAGYLSWRWVADLLRQFSPSGMPVGLKQPASVKRKVNAYRGSPSVQEYVSRLDSPVIPAILRAFCNS